MLAMTIECKTVDAIVEIYDDCCKPAEETQNVLDRCAKKALPHLIKAKMKNTA